MDTHESFKTLVSSGFPAGMVQFNRTLLIMNPSLTKDISPRSLFAYSVFSLLLVLTLMFHATRGHVAYTMDSITYRDATLNFLSGHPMEVTNVASEIPERIPSLQWPPAYPALWAIVELITGLNIDQVPIILTPALLSITTLAMFWICLTLTGRPAVASAVAVSSMFTPSSMAVFGHAWSETLFIPLVLLAFGFLLKYKQTGRWVFWFGAATCIGIANWTRYTGVVFFPLLCLSVFLIPNGTYLKRILQAAGALFASLLITAPLWLHNWHISGNISGSVRGGAVIDVFDRLSMDIETVQRLFEYSLFAFDTMISAHLAIPMVGAVLYLIFKAVRRSGFKLLLPLEIWLPLLWFVINLAFLFYARVVQKGIDMDLRMLAVPIPFFFMAMSPFLNTALSNRKLNLGVFVSLMLTLFIYTGWQEGQRVSKNYLSGKAPRWRADFGLSYRDLTVASSETRALKESIAFLKPSSLVLTDYRALYIRYLTGAKVYSVYGEKDCKSWLENHPEGVLVIGLKDSVAWASRCVEAKPRWNLFQVTGRAAPSMNVE